MSSFANLQTIQIDESDRLWGEELASFLREIENWRAQLSQEDADGYGSVIKLVSRVYTACGAFIDQNGGYEHASMKLDDFRHLNIMRLSNSDHDHAMRYMENIFRAGLIVRQGRFGAFLEQCHEFTLREHATPVGVVGCGYDFLENLRVFTEREHATRLDDFSRAIIDGNRAGYYFCIVAKHPHLSGQALREAFWSDLKTIADVFKKPFDPAMAYQPKYFNRYAPPLTVPRFSVN